MSITPAARVQAARLARLFEQAGATPVEVDILQPAEVLLDLYGENIRHRAYVTSDPLRGELMLRPDFTVPIVQTYMRTGAEPARYTYQGEVFRKQSEGSERPNEFLQVGYEVFDRASPAASDAEVFALFAEVLGPLDLRPATGDIGILLAAISGLATTERRKAALLRHIWRPRRFRALLSRYASEDMSSTRRALLQNTAGKDVAVLVEDTAPVIGLRSAAEIAERVEALHTEAKAGPIPPAEVDVLNNILSVREMAPFALEHLRDIAVDLDSLTPALDRLEDRLEALSRSGIAVDTLEFEASYGRTTLEYYDGFVFGFYAKARPDLPAIASGGRYDALTRVLGQGRSVPAVGGIIRPGLVADLMEAQP